MSDVTEWVRSLIPDLDARVENFRVDTEFLDEELIEAFKEEVAKQGALMKSGIDSGNMEDVGMAAHSIKGMGGTMGLPEISVLAHEIELRAKSADFSSCKSLIYKFLDWADSFLSA